MGAADRVIVVGAGPVGLVTALGLARQGIPVTVLEAEPALTRDLRAGSFHPPTLEMLEPLGITERMLEIGIKVPVWQLRDRREGLVAEFDLRLLERDTRHPYRLHCEQYKLTPIAYELLKEAGGEVLFGTAFIGLNQTDDRVDVVVRDADGERRLQARYVVGADGGRSAVRKALGLDFEGFTWPERFLVVSTEYDLAQHGFAPNAYIADPVEWCAIFQMPHNGPPGLWRVAFPTDTALPDDAVTSPAFCQRLLQSFLPREREYEIAYRSVYRVHQRVASTFRVGRVVLAGDAAHINNPLGGLGLNSGLHDAVNLFEKLGRVWHGTAGEEELDRYVRQRRQTNVEYVQAMSIRNKRLLEEKDPAVRRARLDEMRRIAADPRRAYEHLLNTSMISSVRRAASIQ
ncbi:MAG TPA: FAD-dependent oxidoreductase [Alphaproteobacteria bacterium]